jgi:hypothetical protein
VASTIAASPLRGFLAMTALRPLGQQLTLWRKIFF